MAKVSKKRWLPWIMILPVILIRGITTVYPVFMTFINSFRNLNVIQGEKVNSLVCKIMRECSRMKKLPLH